MGLAHLSPLAPLQDVDLSGCAALTDDGLRCLVASAPALCALNLSNCAAITTAGLWGLLPLRHLRRLVLQGCFGDAGLQVGGRDVAPCRVHAALWWSPAALRH